MLYIGKIMSRLCILRRLESEILAAFCLLEMWREKTVTLVCKKFILLTSNATGI